MMRCTCPDWLDESDGPCAYCEIIIEQRQRQEALAAMGEDEDSLMLGGSGGGERDPDLDWY